MARYIVKRLLTLIPVIIISAIVAFFVTNLMPGNPVRLMLGDFATEEQVLAMTQRLGFDQPLHIRFMTWLQNIFKGDLGESIFLHIPVTQAIKERLEPTLLLAFMGMFFGLLIGLPLGILSAIKHRTVIDQLCISVALIGISVPSFFIAIVLILFFGVKLAWFPVAGYKPIAEVGLGVVNFLVLPGISLGLMQCGLIARMTRSAMLDVMGQQYIKTARAKGLLQSQIILIHALKNAMSPIMTVIGFSLASLLGGTWIIETVFNIPGIGAMAISSILKRDYPVIQGCMLFTVVIYLVVNLLVDVFYALINPSIRLKS